LAPDLVHAAGGIIFRRSADGGGKVLLVHRPAYDDWTFPKGKLRQGESTEECALREVAEETGLSCELVRELSSTNYIDRKGRPKLVRYWEMKTLSGRFQASKEVDKVRWLSFSEAAQALSYPHDVELLGELADAELVEASIILIRHAAAGSRKDWKRDDKQRPLDERGRLQAMELAATLSACRVQRILSSPYTRCIQTVEPLAELLGLQVERFQALAEGTKIQTFRNFVRDLKDLPVVLCTHGDIISGLVGQGRTGKKGSVWVFRDVEGLRPLRYMPPPEV